MPEGREHTDALAGLAVPLSIFFYVFRLGEIAVQLRWIFGYDRPVAGQTADLGDGYLLPGRGCFADVHNPSQQAQDTHSRERNYQFGGLNGHP